MIVSCTTVIQSVISATSTVTVQSAPDDPTTDTTVVAPVTIYVTFTVVSAGSTVVANQSLTTITPVNAVVAAAKGTTVVTVNSVVTSQVPAAVSTVYSSTYTSSASGSVAVITTPASPLALRRLPLLSLPPLPSLLLSKHLVWLRSALVLGTLSPSVLPLWPLLVPYFSKYLN